MLSKWLVQLIAYRRPLSCQKKQHARVCVSFFTKWLFPRSDRRQLSCQKLHVHLTIVCPIAIEMSCPTCLSNWHDSLCFFIEMACVHLFLSKSLCLKHSTHDPYTVSSKHPMLQSPRSMGLCPRRQFLQERGPPPQEACSSKTHIIPKGSKPATCASSSLNTLYSLPLSLKTSPS